MVKYTLLFFFILSVNVNVNAAAHMAPLADPTKPLDYKTKAVNTKQRSILPKLQSILAKGQQRQAIINNKLYTAGQRVNGYQITRIEKDAVLLGYKNRAYKLTLYTKKERLLK